MHVLLQDGREISAPLWWYPRLLHATPEQREKWGILPFGDALHWEEIDEDLERGAFCSARRRRTPSRRSRREEIPLWRPN